MSTFYVNVWLYVLAKYLFLGMLLCHGLVSATTSVVIKLAQNCVHHLLMLPVYVDNDTTRAQPCIKLSQLIVS